MSDQLTERFVAALDGIYEEPAPDFLATLGQRIREEALLSVSPFASAQAGISVQSGSGVDSSLADGDDQHDLYPTAIDLSQPVETEVRLRRGRSMWAAGAVAAAVALAVGVFVVTNAESRLVETDPAFTPTTVDPVSSPKVSEPAPPVDVESIPSLTDSLGFRWSRLPQDEGVFGDKRAFTRGMTAVTVGGPGLVAVGEGDDGAAVWTSADGVTWSRVPQDEAVFGGGGDESMDAVTSAGPGLVAVGRADGGAAVWTSTDGIAWSRVPKDEAVFGGELISVTAGGPGLVAVGSVGSESDIDAAVWTSVDGISWSRVPHDEAVFGGAGEQTMLSVAVGGPGLVAVGSDGFDDGVDRGQLGIWRRDFVGDAAVWTSADGITWSRVPQDEAVFGGEGNQWMDAVTVGGPGLVAVGGDWSSDVFGAAVWTSVDGATWSRVPHDGAVFGGENYQAMNSVTSAGSGLVAVGRAWAPGDFFPLSGEDNNVSGDDSAASVWTSADGITWSWVGYNEAIFGSEDNAVFLLGDGPVFTGSRQFMNSVIATNIGLIAVGADWSSPSPGAAVWVAPLVNRQSASSAGRCIDTETQTEGTIMTTTNTAGLTGRRGWTSAAVAAVVVMLAGSCGGGDDASSAAPNGADQVTAEFGFGPESSLALVDDYFAAHNSGDIDTVFALLTADATFSDTWSPSMDRTDWEPRLAWDMAQGETLISPDCNVVDEVSDLSVTISCAYGTLDAVGVAVDAVKIPTTTELTVTPDGISTIDESYGSPDFLVTGSPFARWMDENNPQDADATGCCEGDTVAESVARGELRAQYATEWAAYLKANDCTYRQTSC